MTKGRQRIDICPKKGQTWVDVQGRQIMGRCLKKAKNGERSKEGKNYV